MRESKIAVGRGYQSRSSSRVGTIASRRGLYGFHTGTAADHVPEPLTRQRKRIRFQPEPVTPVLKRRTPESTQVEVDTDDGEREEARRYLESLPQDPPDADVIQVSFTRRRLGRSR